MSTLLWIVLAVIYVACWIYFGLYRPLGLLFWGTLGALRRGRRERLQADDRRARGSPRSRRLDARARGRDADSRSVRDRVGWNRWPASARAAHQRAGGRAQQGGSPRLRFSSQTLHRAARSGGRPGGQAELFEPLHGAGAAGDAELAVDGIRVRLDRRPRQEEAVTDLLQR